MPILDHFSCKLGNLVSPNLRPDDGFDAAAGVGNILTGEALQIVVQRICYGIFADALPAIALDHGKPVASRVLRFLEIDCRLAVRIHEVVSLGKSGFLIRPDRSGAAIACDPFADQLAAIIAEMLAFAQRHPIGLLSRLQTKPPFAVSQIGIFNHARHAVPPDFFPNISLISIREITGPMRTP